MFVSTKSEDLDGFACGYFSLFDFKLIATLDYVEFSYETGRYNWDWGSEGNDH